MAKSRSELEAMTKDELVEYADDHDIEVHPSWLKDDMVSAILKGEKAAAPSAEKLAAQSTTKPAAQSAKQSAKQSDDVPDEHKVKVDPKLAETQTLANKPPDDSTQFASSFKDEK